MLSRPRQSSGTMRSKDAPRRMKSPSFANRRPAGSPVRFAWRARAVGRATRSSTMASPAAGTASEPITSWQASKLPPSEGLLETCAVPETQALAAITSRPAAAMRISVTLYLDRSSRASSSAARTLAGEFLLVLAGDGVQLTEQRRHEFLLWEGPNDLAVLEQDALALTSGDADVRVLPFTWAVHHAPHHRHVDRPLDLLECFLDFRHHRQDGDVEPAAHRACDQVWPRQHSGARLHDAVADLDFLDRVAGERDPDGVADALLEQDPDPDGALDRAGARRTSLRDAQVQRVGDLVGDRPVGSDHRGRIRRLHRDLDQVVIQRLQDVNVAQRGTDHGRHHLLGRRANAGALLGAAGQRPGVDADSHRHLPLFRLARDLLDLFWVLDIAWIESKAIYARLEVSAVSRAGATGPAVIPSHTRSAPRPGSRAGNDRMCARPGLWLRRAATSASGRLPACAARAVVSHMATRRSIPGGPSRPPR